MREAKKILSVFIAALLGIQSMAFAADVTNVDYTVNGNDEVVVTYDLRADGPCTIRLEVLREDDKNFLIVPRTVSGDIGPNIEPGRGKRIVWQVYKDIKRLQGDVYVQVVAEGGESLSRPSTTIQKKKSKTKWIVLGAVVAAGGVAAILLGRSGQQDDSGTASIRVTLPE
ncbi:hypothetical protein LLG96_02440 [bacterium]|nr:hypothetical protein [bacterium]